LPAIHRRIADRLRALAIDELLMRQGYPLLI
jgi:hypothetical protein